MRAPRASYLTPSPKRLASLASSVASIGAFVAAERLGAAASTGLTGGAGDGYCFDTNSIHAGELSGRKARYVVVVEFHSGVIEDAFSRHGLHFRSPFGLR